MKNDLADEVIVRLAANCGILARGQRLTDIRDAHNIGKDPNFSDQHDARLDNALQQRGA